MPKISIIVPVCNVEKYLSKCLDSIVNQTLKEIEIICIDDGSTDDSGAILDSYSQKDSRIKVIHKKNSGYGNSMNVGMDCAEGEYIGIVESDDCILPEMYEELYRAGKEQIWILSSQMQFSGGRELVILTMSIMIILMNIMIKYLLAMTGMCFTSFS